MPIKSGFFRRVKLQLCYIEAPEVFRILLLLLFLPGWSSANQLENNPSPYLSLHANDPVDWYVWSKQTLDKAKSENKLLFVSVGYFACHWCHVMQRESFSDSDIAKKLNKHFVSVKVDRELNPVLDSRLMTFLQATTGRGGWPMNIILTPDGYSIVGMTYLPAEQFSNVLDRLVENWQEDRKQLEEAAREVDAIIAKQLNAEQFPVKNMRIADMQNAFLQQAMNIADELGGGFGDTMKFPSIPQLSAMLKINQKKADKKVDEFILLTLDKMIHSGLYDVIGGGFFRYTVDPDWQTPHFEKMLYTNAQMVQLYLLAADVYKRDGFRQIALNTLDFMHREMRGKDGAMITSLSAVDNKNVEGGYYLWSADELKKTLTEKEFQLASHAWNINRPATFEAGVLPISSNISADAEKGGQVGDTGEIIFENGKAIVKDTRYITNNLIGHFVKVVEGNLKEKDKVLAKVDKERRQALRRAHSATHLLFKALKEILGDHVKQAGSQVNPDRLRFDFTHFEKLSQEQIKKIEDLVYDWILKNLEVKVENLPLEDALKKGAVAQFEEKYGDIVRVVDIGGVSLELCGGTHVDRSGDIGCFKIISESSVASNVRRIEAYTGKKAFNYLREKDEKLNALANKLNVPKEKIFEKVDSLIEENKRLQNIIKDMNLKLVKNEILNAYNQAEKIGDVKLVLVRLEKVKPKEILSILDEIRSKEKVIFFVLSKLENRCAFVLASSKNLDLDLLKLLKEKLSSLKLKGGGRKDLVQGNAPCDLNLDKVKNLIKEFLK
ncbi:MAG TPA: DUF255 domain-containing protein [Pyrodictiaceae archaeon]|nr:DUF255 domain-containing protein [Pyrodictiaceae archaeon]